ncbi:ABC transporter ATP-binding protein [Halobellus marinus]|uniref:ABC transporter ATP-binding protein n=1 Tax=Halobellus TaxID=1073986 RepID=UPI0028ACF460|nr:ABC transporter ATP-binding protein [Halobellus sp. DFY28]
MSEQIVSFESVSKVYGEAPTAVHAVDNIDAEINKGEFVSVVGPSGCGKSTLLHMTAGLIPPTEGSVSFNGIDVQSESHEKHNVGLVFQEPVLLEWRDVRDNILFPIEILNANGKLEQSVEAYKDRADELVELVGLEGFSDNLPGELSGGMQQRVSVCRGLIHNPELLLMDEPFGALDALTRDTMNQEVLDIWRKTNKTIIFITHNLDEAIFLSDRVIVLSDRPTSIEEIIEIDLDRPRDIEYTRQQDRYQELHSEIYSYFREE